MSRIGAQGMKTIAPGHRERKTYPYDGPNDKACKAALHWLQFGQSKEDPDGKIISDPAVATPEHAAIRRRIKDLLVENTGWKPDLFILQRLAAEGYINVEGKPFLPPNVDLDPDGRAQPLED